MGLPNREICTGCGSCAAVCPKGCIQMVADDEGFLYPQIEKTQCIDCKKCEKTCGVLHPPKVGDSVQIYAAQNVNSAIRQESSSGGIFTALSEAVIRQGGAVCAVVYDEKLEAAHQIAFTMEEVASMRGAKYVQSYAGHLFQTLKKLLAAGKPVMFVGTPCQCAGFRSYLGQDYENLLLVDMICHGVPAPSVWRAYVERRRLLDSNGAKAAYINLRDKSTGWTRYAYSVQFRYPNGDVYSVPQGQNPYMCGFVKNLFLRPSCSRCAFKGIHRSSDLTLGDCWGIWDTHPHFDDNRGTSVLLIHSQKGRQWWQEIQNRFGIVPWTAENVTKWNPSAVAPSVPHGARDAFFARFHAGEPVDQVISDILDPKPPRQSRLKRLLCRLVSGIKNYASGK